MASLGENMRVHKREKGYSRCGGYLGYLANLPENVSIPKECLRCPKLSNCVIDTIDSYAHAPGRRGVSPNLTESNTYWAPVALVLLVVGFVSAGLAFVLILVDYVHAYEYARGWPCSVGFKFGVANVALIALLSSYMIINKKLCSRATQGLRC